MSEDQPTRSWDERIIGVRMAVDKEFQPRVDSSGLSNQSWELIMRAVEFELVHDPTIDQVIIHPHFEQLDSVLPAIAEAESRKGDPSMPGSPQEGSGGLLDRLNGFLGRTNNGDSYRDEAETLATEYASELQAQLKAMGKWDEIVAEEFPELSSS